MDIFSHLTGNLRLYKRRQNVFELGKEEYTRRWKDKNYEEEDEVAIDVEPKANRLVIFRSRDVPHEVLENSMKRFAVSFYISGPAGPGDYKEGGGFK